MIDLLWLDGTWTDDGNRSVVSEGLRATLDPSLVRFVYVDYPGTFGPATGLDDVSPAVSIMAGVDSLTSAVAASPNRVVVGGYSQGAMVAVKFAREVLPRRPDLIVDAVATLGDPHTPLHSHRTGIARPLSVPRPRLTRYVSGDPIADLPLGSPLRTVADVTAWMSIRSPADSMNWAVKVLEMIPTRLQIWWAPWRWHDVVEAGNQIRAYLGTAHTSDYVTDGHCLRLARQIESYS